METLHREADLQGPDNRFTYSFEALIEDTEPKSMYDNEEDIKWVNDQLDSYNSAAWFCAKVTAHWGDIECSDYLGCCSYKSYDDFLNDEYCKEMLYSVTQGLICNLKGIKEALNTMEL